MQLNPTCLALFSLSEICSFSITEDKYKQVFFSMCKEWMGDNKTRKAIWKLLNYILCVCTAHSSDFDAMMSLICASILPVNRFLTWHTDKILLFFSFQGQKLPSYILKKDLNVLCVIAIMDISPENRVLLSSLWEKRTGQFENKLISKSSEKTTEIFFLKS